MTGGQGPRILRAVPWFWALAVGCILIPLAWGAGSAIVIRSEGAGPELGRIIGLSLNSLKLALITACAAGAMGVVMALAWARSLPAWMRSPFVAIAMIPLFVPPGIVAVVAVRLFGANGLLTRVLMPGVETFSVPEPLGGNIAALKPAPVFTIAGAAWTLAFCFAPLVFAAVGSALSRMDRAAEDAARIDGGVAGVLRLVVIPTAGPATTASIALVFILALVEFSVPESLRSLPVLVGEVYIQFGVHYDTQAALVAAGALAALCCVAGGLLARPVAAVLPDVDFEEPDAHHAHWRELRFLAFPGWVLAMGPTAAIVGVLVGMMRHENGPMGALRETIILAHEELLFGFALAGGGAAFAVLLGVGLARAVVDSRSPRWWRLALFLTFLIPGPVWGVGMATALRLPTSFAPEWLLVLIDEFTDTSAPLIVVWTLKLAPIVALLTERAMRAIPPNWQEAASLDGAGPWRGFLSLQLPAIRPTIAAGAAITFALALSDVGAAVLLLPPGTTTLAVRLMTLMHYAPKSEVAALSLLGALPPVLVATMLIRWSGWTLLSNRRR